MPGYSLLPKEEMSTYWETLAEKGKGSFSGRAALRKARLIT